MRILLALIAVVLASCIAAPRASSPPPIPDPEDTASFLVMGGVANCTGTIVDSPLDTLVVLTARHCLIGEPGAIQIDLKEGRALSWYVDAHDHAIVVTDMPDDRPGSPLGPRMKPGDDVYSYGNSVFLDLYRRGYVATTGVIGGALNFPGAPLTVIDITVAEGDSGSGVFNAKGELVGVVSMSLKWGDGVLMAGVLPLAFDPLELQGVVTRPELYAGM